MHNVAVKINGRYKILPKFQAIMALCTDNEAITLPSTATKSFLEKISLGLDNVLKFHCSSDLTIDIPKYCGSPRMFTVSSPLSVSDIEELKNSMAIIEHAQWGGVYQIVDVKMANNAVGLMVERLSVNLDNIT